ncbi:MAG: hypothetical protein PUG66_01620, partial [Clostridiales bacterium]|nr:hypothetical protein [Clostridiales bacterium]
MSKKASSGRKTGENSLGFAPIRPSGLLRRFAAPAIRQTFRLRRFAEQIASSSCLEGLKVRYLIMRAR